MAELTQRLSRMCGIVQRPPLFCQNPTGDGERKSDENEKKKPIGPDETAEGKGQNIDVQAMVTGAAWGAAIGAAVGAIGGAILGGSGGTLVAPGIGTVGGGIAGAIEGAKDLAPIGAAVGAAIGALISWIY